MSYSLVLRGSRLSLGAAASFTASATSTAKAEAEAQVSSSLPDCKDAELTGNVYIDSTIVKCCEEIKRNRHLSVGDQIKGIAECAARGAATATCMVAGVVTYGITTALAPLCGEIGAFVASRVLGYSGAQLGGALVGAAMCGAVTGGLAAPVCAFAMAELIGWLTDSVGPLIESIFDPDAAEEREQAARRAAVALQNVTDAAFSSAAGEYAAVWSRGVASLKALYAELLPSASLRTAAKKQLGFGPVYNEIADAMVRAGAYSSPRTFVEDFLERSKNPPTPDYPGIGIGCALFDDSATKDGYSEICPFHFPGYYKAYATAANLRQIGAEGDKARVAFNKRMQADLQRLASVMFPALTQALIVITTRITTVATVLKEQELLQAAEKATREQLATKIAVAASRAEVAADAAKKGSSAEAKQAIVRAAQQYDIAEAAYQKLLFDQFGGKPTTKQEVTEQQVACLKDTYCKRGLVALIRAATAKKNAPLFAAQTARSRLLLGAAAAAGAVGAAYFFTRR